MERLASPGRTAARQSRLGNRSLRQLSTTERMAAIRDGGLAEEDLHGLEQEKLDLIRRASTL